MGEAWRHEHVEANGIRFHYVTMGDGPLVLLLHGFPQFWYAWRHQIPALAKRFRVVAPDLRGYGGTDKPKRVREYRITALAADVAALIRALGESQAHVVGHDWGGGVAWAAAIRHPEVVRKLAILNCPHPRQMTKALRTSLRQLRRSWYMFFFQLPWLPERFLLRDGAAFVEPALRGWARDKTAFTDEDLGRFREAIRVPGAATAAVHYYRAAARYPGGLGKGIVEVPTLVIWAEEDRALGKELTFGMERWVTGPYRVEYIPRCSHWVNEERPEKVNELLLGFLEGS